MESTHNTGQISLRTPWCNAAIGCQKIYCFHHALQSHRSAAAGPLTFLPVDVASRFVLSCPVLGVANGTSKNVGLGKFWQDLEISKAFSISLEVSFLHGLIFTFLDVSKLLTMESRARIFKWDLGVSASLGFYHSPPLVLISLCGKFLWIVSLSIDVYPSFTFSHAKNAGKTNNRFPRLCCHT